MGLKSEYNGAKLSFFTQKKREFLMGNRVRLTQNA